MSDEHLFAKTGNISVSVYEVVTAYHFNFPCDNIKPTKKERREAIAKAKMKVMRGKAEDRKRDPEERFIAFTHK